MAVEKTRGTLPAVTSRTDISRKDPDGALGEEIARRAYEIWEQEGKPPGRAKEHWQLAKAEVLRQAGYPHEPGEDMVAGVEFFQADGPGPKLAGTVRVTGEAASLLRQAVTDRTVSLQRSPSPETADQALWAAIRNRTDAIGFTPYNDFMARVFRGVLEREEPALAELGRVKDERDYVASKQNFYGTEVYNLLRLATEAFLMLEGGVRVERPRHPATGGPISSPSDRVPGEESRLGKSVTWEQLEQRLQAYLGADKTLPYLKRIITAIRGRSTDGRPVGPEYYARRGTLEAPILEAPSEPLMIELIWSYWHEEGMLVQAVNAISMRFQNIRRGNGQDPLAFLELDPLRGLSNLLWGYIQDEPRRLSVRRRAHEYAHHYGLTLDGRAVAGVRSADARSGFVEAFHDLLHRCAIFYQEDADTTVISDGFPLLNALKELHRILAYGAHNQFRDLPYTARVEMLIQEWLMSRPEMREFLGGRVMVPYPETWMAQVETVKQLNGWTPVSVVHFRDLGAFGEKILLSVRYGDWSDVTDQEQAKNWARYWRPEIQGYIHAYRAAAGVDLSQSLGETVAAPTRALAERYAPPSTHLRRRLPADRGTR